MTTEIDKANSEYSRQLEAQIKGHVCYCGVGLNVAWGGAYGINEYIIRCGNGHINPKLRKVKSDWQLWKEGILIDPYRDQQAKRQEERRRKDGTQVTHEIVHQDSQGLSGRTERIRR